MVTLTDAQRDEMVQAAIETIKAKAVTDASAYLANIVRDGVQQVLWEEVCTLVQTEIVPAVRDELLLHKAVLVRAAVASAETCAAAIAEALVQALTDRLATEYQRNDIIKTMFGVR